MRQFRNSAVALALLATPSTLLAQTTAACMTEREATALFEYALPELLDSVATKCSPVLPKQAFLSTQATQYVSRYRASATSNWPLAKAAFLKAAGPEDKADKILAAIPDDALKALVGVGIGTAIAGDIKPAECPRIDKLVSALAPLPPANVSQIIVQILAIEGDKGSKAGKSDDFRICQG